ncbi:hypothetical protein D6D24_04337 [Aureobasidium pullulans]|uniref:Uncharacterized protein n=1 Tax=Aureobasidium pullulans TaxID=5580 RepID=A0A4S8VXB3_AURPU|nr:hypothetical protein D6D24_04337 [Aureobasidium pullulans]
MPEVVTSLDVPFPDRDIKSQRGMPQTEGPILIGRLFPDITKEEACLLPTIEYIPPDNPSGRNMQNHRNRVYGIAHLRHVALVWIFVPKKERCLLLPQVYDIEGRPYEYYREIARDAWRNSPQRLEVEGALRSVERDPTVGPSSTVPSATVSAMRSVASSTTVTATPSAASSGVSSAVPSVQSPARGVVAQTAASLTETEAARGLTQTGVETPFPLPEAEPQPVVPSAQKVPNPVNRGRVVVTLEDESDDEEDAEALSHGQQPIVSTPTKRSTEGPTSRPEKRAKRRSPTIPTSTGSSSQSSSPASYAASHMSSPLASSQGSGYSTDATSVDGSPQSQKLPPTLNPQKDSDVVMFDQDFRVEDFLTPEEIRDSIASIDEATARQEAGGAGPAKPRHIGKRKEQRTWEVVERSVLIGLVKLGQQELERVGVWYDTFINDLLEIKGLLVARPVDHPDRLRWDGPIDQLIRIYITEG